MTSLTINADPMTSLTVDVDLVDHILELFLAGVLSQRFHHSSQLFRRNRAVAILVEQRERFLELCEKKNGFARCDGTLVLEQRDMYINRASSLFASHCRT